MSNNTPPRNDLTIIVVNYNGRRWLEQLLPSLEAHFLNLTRLKVEVVVVDNASADDSLTLLKQWPWVTVMASPENGGFAKGNNVVLQSCTSPYVLLLNSDTTLPTGEANLDLLIAYMEEQPNVAVVTPRLVMSDGKLDPACHRGEPTPWASLTYFLGLERLFPRSRCFGRYHQGWKDLHRVHQVDACSGATMVVRTAAVTTVGCMDERYFMYGEDLDWCRRFRDAGYSVVYHPGATIIHHKYKSGLESAAADNRKTTKAWFYLSMQVYFDTYYPSKRFGLFRLLLKAYVALKSLK